MRLRRYRGPAAAGCGGRRKFSYDVPWVPSEIVGGAGRWAGAGGSAQDELPGTARHGRGDPFRGERGTAHETLQWAERGGRTESREVQPRHRGLERGSERR